MQHLPFSLVILLVLTQQPQFGSGRRRKQPFINRTLEDGSPRLSDEQRLLMSVLTDYDPQVRPVTDVQRAVTVFIGLNLIQIFDLDEKNQVLIANCWLDMEWTDEYMRWNPRDYNSLEIIRIYSTSLWIPDIVLYNNAEEYKQNKITTRAMVSYDGNVIYPVPTKIYSSCKIDVTFFPFDEQLCRLKYGSWSYNGWRVDITNRTQNIDTSNYVPNGEWDVIELYQERHLVFYSCCVEPYSDVTFYIRLRRKTLYYFLNVFFPSIVMSTMTVLVFLLPADSHQKITLGITTLLSYSVFTLSIVQKLPETSEYLPLISVYLASVLTVTSLSVLSTVAILTLHYRSTSSLKPIPTRIKRLFFNLIGQYLCIPQPGLPSTANSLKKIAEQLQLISYARPSGDIRNSRKKMTSRKRRKNNAYLLPEDLSNKQSSSILSHYYYHSDGADDCDDDDDYDDDNGDDNNRSILLYHQLKCAALNRELNTGAATTRSFEQYVELRRIVQSLDKIAKRDAGERRTAEIIHEWQHLAIIFDRILFIIFLLITLATTIFLAIGPRRTSKVAVHDHHLETVSSGNRNIM